MSLQHEKTFFHAFQNKKFLSRRDLATYASISTVSADKIAKKFLTLNLLKERKSPHSGDVGRPTRVLYVNPKKHFLILSLSGDDYFQVFLYSLALSQCANTSYSLNKLLTREENILTFFRETDLFIKQYFPDNEIVACGILLPSCTPPKHLWDTVQNSAIEHYAARFFPDIPCALFSEMCAGSHQLSRKYEKASCVKITDNCLFAGVNFPVPREIDLSQASTNNQLLSMLLESHKDISSLVPLLGEMLYNLSLILDIQTFFIDHSVICQSSVFTEQIAMYIKENFRRANLTLNSFSPERSLLYIHGCTELTLHSFLKIHLNGGTE